MQAFEEETADFPPSGPSLYGTRGWSALLELCGWGCARCRDGGQLYAVFVVPLRDGGRPTLANVQPLCACCRDLVAGTGQDFRPRRAA